MGKELEIFQLPNGISVVHQHAPYSTIGHFAVFINAGSRDEKKGEHGLAHFIEHALFKGTNKRKAFHVLNRMEVVGGEINAYTTKEETCLYSSFQNEYFDRAIELLSDIIYNSTFPDVELEREKDVINDEIHAYLDTPSEQIFDDFEDAVFNKHDLGHGILGTHSSISGFDGQKVRDFYQRYYGSSNFYISSYGNIPTAKLKKMLLRHFETEQSVKRPRREKTFDYQPFSKEVKRDTYQAHFLLGNQAYSVQDPKRTGLALLTNILGGPSMNSRLNLEIREKKGIAYNIEANYSPYADSGIFTIYLGTDRKSYDKSIRLVHKELQKMREIRLGVNQLHQAKQQLKGNIALSQESGSNMLLSAGKSLCVHGRVDTIAEVYQKIDALTAEHLQDIANEVFDPKQLSFLSYH